MFELLNPTSTKIVDVVVLSQKNRQPDDNPGAKISVEQQLANGELAHFDGNLRGWLYTKKPGAGAAAQQQLDGVDPISDTPHLTAIGSKLGWFHWALELTGYTVVVDHGTGGKSDLTLSDCTISGFRFKCNEGGTIDCRYDIESNDVSEKAFGRLAKLKSTDVDVTVRPPEISGQGDLVSPAPRLTPAQLRQANAEGKTIEQKAAEVKGAAGMNPVQAWPFPGGKNTAGGARDPSMDGMNPAPKDATAAVLADVKKNGPGHSANPKPKKPAKTKRAAPIKMANPPAQYRDPASGQTWTGRGLKPKWLAIALEQGKTLADFQVKAH